MNQRTVDLPLFWSAEQAATVLEYLDKLRDLIWETYREEIIALRTAEEDEEAFLGNQRDFELGLDQQSEV